MEIVPMRIVAMGNCDMSFIEAKRTS